MLAFLVIIVVLIILFPYIMRFAQRLMLRRMEKMFRRAAGLDEEPKKSKRKRKESRREESARGSGPIIPKEYAEDVEFVETKVFTEEIEIKEEVNSDGSRRVKAERQVTDVEWEEIKE